MKKTHILPLIGLSLCAASLAQTPDEQAPAAPAAEQPAPPTEAPAPAAPAAEQPAPPTEALTPVAPAAEQPAPPTEAPAPAVPAAEQPTPPTEAPAPVAPAAEQPAPPAEAPAPVAPAAEQPTPPTEAPAPAAPAAEQPTPPTEAPAPNASPKEQADPAPTPQTPPSPEEIREVLSYYLGYRTGQNMTQVGPIKTDDIDISIFVAAFADGIVGNPPDQKIREKDLTAIMEEYEKELQVRTKEAVAKNTELSDKKAEEYAKEEGVQKLPSGILAKELSPGSGAKYDEEEDGKNAIVRISYQLRLLDDTKVDESVEPIEMPIDSMLPSIVDSIKQMPVGAEWDIFIPYDKGYGEQGMGPLKCCTPFMFRVKLHEIKKAPAPTEQPIQLTPEMIKQLQEQGLQPSKA